MQLHILRHTRWRPFFREVRRRILNELSRGEGRFVSNNFISEEHFLCLWGRLKTTCVCKFLVEKTQSLKLEMSKYTLLVCRLKCFLERLKFPNFSMRTATQLRRIFVVTYGLGKFHQKDSERERIRAQKELKNY